MAKVGHYYPHATLSDYVPRLKSDWLTGREKYIHITPDDHGAFTITGENFWLYGWAAGDFVVLEQAPEPIACKA
jgi:hypothetical protein